jgi:hypothetical protein
MSARFVLEFLDDPDQENCPDLKWQMVCPDCDHVFWDGGVYVNYSFSVETINRVVYSHRCHVYSESETYTGER